MDLRIARDNKIDGFNLLSGHNPLAFIAELDYDGLTPPYIQVELLDTVKSLGIFKAISFKDVAPQTRQYIFIADDIIRGNMDDFTDFNQSAKTLVFVENITKEFRIRFTYDVISVETSFVVAHASRQFGDGFGVSMNDVNTPKTYTCGKGGVVYLYIYNDDINNVITVEGLDYTTAYALDSDLDNFTNSNGNKFTINII